MVLLLFLVIGGDEARPQCLQSSYLGHASYMMGGSLQCIGIERAQEPIAPAIDWLRIRSVEAALINTYAARPPVWIGQVAEGVAPGLELRVYP